MANEYRIYYNQAEVVSTGAPSADVRVHKIGAETVSTGLVDAPAHVYQMRVEIVRSLLIAFRPEFIDDIGDETFPVKFTESFRADIANENEEFTVWGIEFIKGTEQNAPAVREIGEWNPFRPNLAGTPVEEYLDEQAGIIREQHNKAQAGDSTFDLARLIKTSATKEFTLGSLGRFATEDNGLLLARYVQFSGMAQDQRNPAPVGRLATSESVDWIVTNDFAKSGRDLATGIGFYEAPPADNSYGWVVTHGANPFPLFASTEVIPSTNAPYSWTETGKVGLASRGNVVCRRWGASFGSGIGAGAVFICVEQLGVSELIWLIDQQTSELTVAQAALEGRVATTETAISTQAGLITANTASITTLTIRIQREEEVRAREIQALRTAIGTGVDIDAAILSGLNVVRAEFAAADDTIRATATEALRIANAALTATGGGDFAGINAQLVGLTAAIGAFSSRLSGVSFNLTGMTANQILKAVQTGTDSLGVGIFEFQPITHNIDNLIDVDTSTTPPTNGQALVWNSASSLWKPATVGGGGGGSAWAVVYANAVITNPTPNIDVNVSAFKEVYIVARLVTTSSTGTRQIQVSVDGGATFYGTVGDYVHFSDTGAESGTTGIIGHGSGTTAARTIAGDILGIDLTGLKLAREIGGGRQRLFVASTSPITHIRLNNTAGNMTGGSYYVWGR